MPNIQDTMLGNELLVGRFLLPATKAHFQFALEPIQENNDIIVGTQGRVPDDAIDYVCLDCYYAILATGEKGPYLQRAAACSLPILRLENS